MNLNGKYHQLLPDRLVARRSKGDKEIVRLGRGSGRGRERKSGIQERRVREGKLRGKGEEREEKRKKEREGD